MRLANPIAGWNALLAISIAVLLTAFGMHFLLPDPKPKTGPKQRILKEGGLREELDALKEKIKADQQTFQRYVWPGDAKLAEAEAMALVTRVAKKHEISLGAFRPQKAIEDQGLRRLPFSLNLEGPFPNVLGFLSELETPSNRLAVQMLQMSSGDSISDQVSATMTVMAFQEVVPPPKPSAAASALAARIGTVETLEGARKPGPAGPKTTVEIRDSGAPGPKVPKAGNNNGRELNIRTPKASSPH